jgi:putative two-component system response regulator
MSIKKATVLIVDDEPTILASMSTILGSKYRVLAANSGIRALSITMSEPSIDLILLDVMMPEMDGYAALEKLKQQQASKEIPVIFVTAMEAQTDEEKGLALGAVDYITKPVKPAILLARTKTHISLKQASNFLHDQNAYLEAEVQRRMKENLVIQNVSIRALAHLAETRDPETGDHILRTQSYVKLLAQQLQKHPRFKSVIDKHYIGLLTRSAPLHDIGKVGIPDHVLLKPGKLNAEEWEIMKTHTELGAIAIDKAEKDVNEPVEFLSLSKDIVRYHHERWDGMGYPRGLAKDEIPLSARIMAVADVFDALISKRVYKEPFTLKKSIEIIKSERGKHFDPDIIDTFMTVTDKFVEISNKYKAEN